MADQLAPEIPKKAYWSDAAASLQAQITELRSKIGAPNSPVLLPLILGSVSLLVGIISLGFIVREFLTRKAAKSIGR